MPLNIVSDPAPDAPSDHESGDLINEGEAKESTPLATSDTTPVSPAPSAEPTGPTTTVGGQPDNPLATETTTPPASTGGVVVSAATTKSPAEQAAEIDAMLFARVANIHEKSSLKILLYGDPGCTKSSFLGGAANQLVYEIETGGLKSLLSAPRPMKTGIQHIPFVSFTQAALLIQRLAEGAQEQFEVFSIDSITDLNRKAMEQHLIAENSKRPSKSALVPETEDYIQVNEQMTRLIRAVRDMNRDVILTAHAKTVEPKNKPAKTYPDMSESLANRIEGFVDLVAHVEMRKIANEDGTFTMKPVFRVVSDGQTHAKNRLGILQEEILDPTWDDLKAVHMANLERASSS